MSARAARRLPGVRFESRSPGLPDALPRMDVAAFVGFAAAGPLHTPVAVEDPATFADLYGEDAPLAWDRERGEMVRANLGPAVRGFFRNGGTRCWVVRVAGTSASTNHYPVPGLARLGPAGARPLFMAARSPGSWSDRLEVSAGMAVQPATALAVELDGVFPTAVRLLAADTVAAGDLLRLRWSDERVGLFPVEKVEDDVAVLAAGGAVWLLPAPAPGGGAWSASYFPRHDAAAVPLQAPKGEPTLRTDGTATVVFDGETPLAPGQFVLLARGADPIWLTVTEAHAVTPGGLTPGAATEVSGRWSRPSAAAPATAPTGPLLACERVRVELWFLDGGGHPRRLGDLGLAPGHPRYLGALPTDASLFAPDEDLLSPDERALRDRVRALAGDGAYLRGYHADLWDAVATPRFPFAVDSDRTDVFLPLGAPIVPDAYGEAEPLSGDAAVRDGLAAFDRAPFLDPDLVADDRLLSLQAQADHLRFQQPSPRRLTGIHAVLALEEATLVAVPDCVHRDWSAEDVAPPAPLDAPVLRARPDALGGWQLTWDAVGPGELSVLEESETADFTSPVVRVFPADATGHTVPALPPARRWFRLRSYRPHAADASAASYFVVRDPEAAGSFWSDPAQVVTPPPQFTDCPPGALGVPHLEVASPPDRNGTYQLAWSEVPGALRYAVEESTALDFLDAVAAFSGPGRELTIYGRAPGRLRYRVRAEGSLATVGAPVLVGGGSAIFDVTGVQTAAHLVLASAAGDVGEETVFDGQAFTARYLAASTRVAIAGGFRYHLLRDEDWAGPPSFSAFVLDAAGGWSDGVTVTVASPPRRILAPASSYDGGAKSVLLSVQAELVRLAAARGDLLAVLGLPAHYRDSDAVNHVTELRGRLPEERAPSYAALYHPWLLVEGAEGVRRAPPDGAATGVMAARAATRGAWIAPANQPLGDVLGLTPLMAREQAQRLYEAQVNLIRDEPHGFVALGADTLSVDPDLAPINVRRLLALLRRIALRVGPAFVFEPAGPVFRRTVERELGAVLGRMYRAGAFAGASPSSAFQIAVDPAGDAEALADQGRFVVELKVAPSLPLAFLTVRLVQNGVQGQVTEGA